MSQGTAKEDSRQAAERRDNRRYAVDLPALVSNSRGQSFRCRVKDYCLGGMLVAFDQKTGALSRDTLVANDEVTIKFRLEIHGAGRWLTQTARVARILDKAFGISFVVPDSGFIQTLREYTIQSAREAAPASGMPSPRNGTGDLRRTVAVCKHLLKEYLPGIYKEILTRSLTALSVYRQQDCPQNFVDQHALAADAGVLKSEWQKQALAFHGYLQNKIDRILPSYTGQKQAQAAETGYQLSLVEHNEFEDWLCVADLSARLYERHRRLLDLLGQRFAGFVTPPGDKFEFPLGPDTFGNAIHEVTHSMDLRPDTKQIIFQQTSLVLEEHLGVFYQELSQTLEKQQRLTTAPTDRSPARSVRRPRPARGGPSLRCNDATADSPGTDDTAGSSASAPGFSLEEVRDLLNSLAQDGAALPGPGQQDDGVQGRISSSLSRQEHGQDIDNLLRERLISSERLLDILFQDSMLTAQVSKWIRVLRVPLLKAALLEPQFFRDSDHPLRRILNQLEHLGLYLVDAKDEAAGEDLFRVDRLIERLNEGYDDDAEIVSQISEELMEVENRHSRAYKQNIERVVLGCEGRQRIRESRLAVEEEINRRFAGKPIPKIVVELFNAGWKSLLQLTYVREGSKGDNWTHHLAVLERLVNRLTQPTPVLQECGAQDVDLYQLVEQAIESVSFDPFKKEKLLGRLKQLLLDGGTVVDKADTDLRWVPGFGTNAESTNEQDVRPAASDISDQQWAKVMQQARSLGEGARVEVADEAGDRQILRVAWISEGRAKYVFADSRGLKARELSLDELACMFHQDKLRLHEETGVALIDRALQTMFEEMEEQLSYQASHDALTGLINRKGFIDLIETSFDTKREDRLQQLLLYVDLDRFEWINDTYGHQAGDQLISLTGDLLRSEIGDRGIIAHLRADRFAILLENCDERRGMLIAGHIIHALRKAPFMWGDSQLSVETHIGLLVVTNRDSRPVEILANVESACRAAKEGGRKRIEIYRHGTPELPGRERPRYWVARIDSTLKEDRIQLRCQQISPVHHRPGDLPYYEILLGVYDEQGRSVCLKDFIEAAERYNRMAAVDRVVIRKALTWIGKNRQLLDQVGGFSINLSGHSLDDRHLPELVRQLFAATRVPPEKIIFEITETVVVSDLTKATRFISQIKTLGCRFALDDFGTGHSSYSYLKTLPVDLLKIDGIFVKDLVANRSDYAVVKSINEISHFMGKRTVAEYVENEDIVEKLEDLGVDYAQGFGIEPPRLLDDLAVRIEDRFVIPALEAG